MKERMPKKTDIVRLTVEQFNRLAEKGALEKVPLVELVGYVVESSMDRFGRYAIFGDRKNEHRAMVLFAPEAVNPDKRPALGIEGRAVGTPEVRDIHKQKKHVLVVSLIERL